MAELAYAQLRTEQVVHQLGIDLSEFKDEMSEFKAEMKTSHERSERGMEDFKLEMRASRQRSEREMAEFKQEMKTSHDRFTREMKTSHDRFEREMKTSHDRFEREMKASHDRSELEAKASRERSEREMSEFKEEMQNFKGEMQKFRTEANKQWGNLANKLGTITEDIVFPNIQRMALEDWGLGKMEDCYCGPTRSSRRGEPRTREFDVVCAGAERVVLCEVKTSAKVAQVETFAESLKDFFDFFPEYEGRELIPVFSSWSLDDKVRRRISELKLYGVAMGDETMEIVARP